MVNFAAIVKWDAEFRVSKSMLFDNQADAGAHIASVIGAFPEAFATDATAVAGQPSEWIADPVAETVSFKAGPFKHDPLLPGILKKRRANKIDTVKAGSKKEFTATQAAILQDILDLL